MSTDQPRRLYRSESDSMISGVCGGIADYLSVDPAIVRIVFVVAVLANGAGLLIYLVLAIVLPKESSVAQVGEETVREGVRDLEARARHLASEARRVTSNVGEGEGAGGEEPGDATEDPIDGDPAADVPSGDERPSDDPVGPAQPVAPGSTAAGEPRADETRSRNRAVVGWLLVVVGGWLLLGQLGLRLPDWLGALLWPAVLIAAGLLLVLRRR